MNLPATTCRFRHSFEDEVSISSRLVTVAGVWSLGASAETLILSDLRPLAVAAVFQDHVALPSTSAETLTAPFRTTERPKTMGPYISKLLIGHKSSHLSTL